MEEKELIKRLVDIRTIPLEQLSRYLLAQDNLYRKIPLEQQEELIQEALQCGKAAAELPQSLSKYVETQGIQIERFQEEAKSNQFNFVLAEFQLPNQIRLNQRLIQQGEALIERYPELSFFTDTASLTEILIAHEVFHYLEHQQGFFTLQRQLEYKTGPFKRQARLYSLSEIAAGSFVQSLLQLDFHPLLLNPLVIYPVDPEFSQKITQDFLIL